MTEKLKSESIVVSSPLSFNGSSLRIWKITDGKDGVIKFLFALIALTAILCAWMFVGMWYFMFGLWVVPYRMIRRSGRRQKRDKLRHQELINAIKSSKQIEKE